MTVVFIGGTNGLLSQVTVRNILALVMKSKTVSDAALSQRKYGQELQRRVRLEGYFYDDLPESTQGP